MQGRTYGLWTVLARASARPKETNWICRCACGTVASRNGHSLRRGASKSCGCAAASLASRTKTLDFGPTAYPAEHRVWSGMKTRCFNPKDKHYRDYGGRGITICDRWLGPKGFENFVRDMGPRPSSAHKIDRIDNDGGYAPDNCRWVTQREQNRNYRRNLVVTVDGQPLCLADACTKRGANYHLVYARLQRGWDLERAICAPLDNRGSRKRGLT